ncbi:hypothetical protein CEUSTIGMA_g7788.t1 [Chlamydomonas eustigma]|uniref:Phosphate acetyl/butaryl transferase domain-containing protein n=1 Tax=Chlamydomonas eustigma TaxID=1157962 RepID=A0A250XBS3_9CHLO|nr:hypothetical protein CEUSTIGMA_g7788.t1 [Chlamydomonas eustigma]|eukprot:GAX80349.1 hypothetical protein CEUSTIGMA_g7788.t1 [Chlamydomonas eustigma]
MIRDAAVDTIKGDPNLYGTLMVLCGDVNGMVSGALHTTASTIRPAMQVGSCDSGDCAVNMNPSSEELAQIAVESADTALSFGIEPLVAMLSDSSLESGRGPDVDKVKKAVDMVRALRPDLSVSE